MSASNIARPVLALLVPEQHLDRDDPIDVIEELNLGFHLGRAVEIIWQCDDSFHYSGANWLDALSYLERLQQQPRLCGQGKHVQKAIEKIDEILEGLSGH